MDCKGKRVTEAPSTKLESSVQAVYISCNVYIYIYIMCLCMCIYIYIYVAAVKCGQAQYVVNCGRLFPKRRAVCITKVKTVIDAEDSPSGRSAAWR